MISLSLTIGSNRRLCNKIYNYYRIPGIQPATRYCGSRLNWFLFDSGYASTILFIHCCLYIVPRN